MDTQELALPEPSAQPDYYSLPGLSNSGMKDLAISPLRYWHLWINPEAPKPEPSPEMIFGSALHCKALEPDQFEKRYARAISPADFPGCLVTMDDLRQWLRDNSNGPKGVCKDHLINQVLAVDPNAPIYEVLKERHSVKTAGKTILKAEDWDRVHSAADSLLSEPIIQDVLKEGRAEVPMTAIDPETGVLLKAKMDWVSAKWTLDLKTFSQQRGKSIDQSVSDAIWYERYYRQAYLYSFIRSLQPGFEKPGIAAVAPPFMLAFVESQPPHEVRIRVLQAKVGGEINMLWEVARLETRQLIRTYADCMEQFGTEKPWRYAAEAHVIQDGDIRQVAYAF